MDRERFKSENLVTHSPDRPTVMKREVIGGWNVEREDQLAIKVVVPLIEHRVVRGHTIGGGTSDEALRRARKHLMRVR